MIYRRLSTEEMIKALRAGCTISNEELSMRSENGGWCLRGAGFISITIEDIEPAPGGILLFTIQEFPTVDGTVTQIKRPIGILNTRSFKAEIPEEGE